MKKLLLIWLGKIVGLVSRALNIGAGSTWPGHIALEVEPRILPFLLSQLSKGAIIIAGTNGKTTTAKMVSEILGSLGNFGSLGVIRNESGANLLNGMVSALIQKSDWFGRIKADWAILEVDEATLPLALAEFTPKIIVLLNLFRDQLDRYGEIDLIADKWLGALRELREETTVIINADDPHLAFIGKNLKTKKLYFGLDDPRLFLGKMEHAVDSVYCPNCGQKLEFEGCYFSHLGIWRCLKCGLKRPKPDLANWSNWSNLKGVYNRYNTLAAVLVAKAIGIKEEKIKIALEGFIPAFGRQEEFKVGDKKVRVLLSKNPTGFNESIRTLREFPGKKKVVLLVLNDRIPDGRDVSWIWDVDTEELGEGVKNLIISGDRAFDMGLRIKYSSSNVKLKVFNNLKEAVYWGLKEINKGETLYVLPTYSAMLEARKILTGRKIL